MQTNHLKRNNPNTKRTIVARGGKRGKTAGRGGKGQSARAGNKRRPEWRDIIKRVPKLRGRGVSPQKPVTERTVVVNLAALDVAFSANDQVTPATLIEKGLITTISGRVPSIKVLGEGETAKALKVSGLLISGSAKEKIEKAGGTVAVLAAKVIANPAKEEKARLKKEMPPKAKPAKAEKPAKKEKAK